MKKILIIDYGTGNSSSLREALRRSAGVNPRIGLNQELISKADGIILPGVGNFDCAMRKIREKNCFFSLKEKIQSHKIPLLGICLGMHLLGSKSDEGDEKGLGFVKGYVSKLKLGKDSEKAPHVGWTTINLIRSTSIFEDAENKFYFLHNYKFICDDASNVVAREAAFKGINAIIQKENIFGVQFHPEKSLENGDKLLNNFVRIC